MIQLPTCKQRSSISKSQGVRFNQLHGYSVITPDIHPSLLQPGNLVPQDLLNITSTWKLTTEGFTHPHLCTVGCLFFFVLFFVFFFLYNGHPSQNTATLHRNPGHSNRHHHHLATCIRRIVAILTPVLLNISHK